MRLAMPGRIVISLVLCSVCLFDAPILHAHAQLTRTQELELKTLSGQLSDAKRSIKTKLEAAELLLARRDSRADDILKSFLASPANSSARIAVAMAISRHGSSNAGFIEPLLSMLTGKDQSVRAPAARALVTYKNPDVISQLVFIANDGGMDKPVRLVTIEALSMVLDKSAVGALVRLLDDTDATIRDAALLALTKLANNRDFGKDRYRWRLWWARNKHKKKSQWLSDLADSLVRAKASLEADNARLRKKLGEAMIDLYTASAASRQQSVLMGFLNDPLADVRLVGLRIIELKISATDKLPPEVSRQVLVMLDDEAPDVRRASALQLARFGQDKALSLMLSRLAVEESPSVKEGLLTAIGHLQSPDAVPSVIKQVGSKYESVAAAAATALVRIASKQPLKDMFRAQALKILAERYKQTADNSDDGAALREALLTAMGVLGDGGTVGVLTLALKDSAATVRLAAVNALANLGKGESAEAIVALIADGDRGVRRAVITALGALDGRKYRQIIFQRTDPQAEADSAVRQQAWDVSMKILGSADAEQLSRTAASLVDRPDASGRRIEILRMLVTLLDTSKAAKLPEARIQLAQSLTKASRHSEAAEQLAEVYTLYKSTGNAQASAIRKQWVGALLHAGDPTVVTVIAEQKNPKVFAEAMGELQRRLAELFKKDNHDAVILLSSQTLKVLEKRMTASQLATVKQALSKSLAKRIQTDRTRVAYLVTQLQAKDESARGTAGDELQAMAERAIVPLLDEFKKTITTANASPQAEKTILAVLKQLAPKLTGYKTDSPLVDRLKLITTWQKQRLKNP